MQITSPAWKSCLPYVSHFFLNTEKEKTISERCLLVFRVLNSRSPNLNRTWGPGNGYPGPGRELRAPPAGKAGGKPCGDQVPAQPQEARSFTSRSHRRMIVPRHQRPTSNIQPPNCFFSFSTLYFSASNRHPNFPNGRGRDCSMPKSRTRSKSRISRSRSRSREQRKQRPIFANFVIPLAGLLSGVTARLYDMGEPASASQAHAVAERAPLLGGSENERSEREAPTRRARRWVIHNAVIIFVSILLLAAIIILCIFFGSELHRSMLLQSTMLVLQSGLLTSC